ncbi:MAG: hypothetical protein RL292_93 [Candidatus Parcubacteria bacterium]|jgi:hypothetical protein
MNILTDGKGFSLFSNDRVPESRLSEYVKGVKWSVPDGAVKYRADKCSVMIQSNVSMQNHVPGHAIVEGDEALKLLRDALVKICEDRGIK